MNVKLLTSIAGLFLIIAPVVLPAPDGMSGDAWLASGLALAMALWWLTEPIPLAATALLPLAVAPILNIADLGDVSRSYSQPLVILFLGGFLLAKAIEKSGLHRRLAISLVGFAGTSPTRVLAAIMATTAFLSLWISNTASAMVIAPIAAAIAAARDDHPRFGTALMLGVAFAATIGGMGSLIGTPPNAIFAAFVSATYSVDVGFAQWAAVGVPVAMILLVIAWAVLVWVTPGLDRSASGISLVDDLHPSSPAERRVAVIAALTALAWITRPAIEWVAPDIPLSDAGIAMLAAMALFLVPAGDGERLLDWDAAGTLRWDVLILFGGGLALAGILEQTQLAAWIAGRLEGFAFLPGLALVFIIAALVVFIGELASNTAMAAIFLPIAGATAISLNLDPVAFMLPVALAASIGFMLPVATPPNAIVFANPAVTRGDMLRAGAPLDVIGILVAVGLCSFLGPQVFD